MILEQHYLGCLAQASYLVVDEETRTACVVDPRRDVELYLERARELGATIRHVILTHFHADFLAGHLELRARTGATIHLGVRARADYDFEPLAEGDELVFGEVRLAVLETPGHTPESICLVVYDASRDPERPHAVFTGDTLFIGDVGRPDLMASVGVTREELAGMLYDSLHDKVLRLPDETLLYPGHGAGSACGKNLSSDTVSTIGAQRATNYALQPMARDAFVRVLTEGLAEPPAYFSITAGLNKGEHAGLDEVLEGSLVPLDLGALRAAVARGAQVLDVRSEDAFVAGHLPGSVHIGPDGMYASWAGTLLDLERPIVLVTEPGAEREAALRLGRIGLDRVVGYLDGGAAAFEETASLGRVAVDELARQIEAGEEPFVLDVRQPGEHASAHLEGAAPIPLGQLEQRLDEVPRDRPVYVHCQTGYRSVTAASLLARAGYREVIDVAGGFEAWQEAGLPGVVGESCQA